jgi:RNA polymerase sigma factor (sigma-70 family)
MQAITMAFSPDAGRNRLAEIFFRERARLLQLVRRRLFDVSGTDAEDLVQDVFLNILRRADLIEQIENLTGYVYQSLANRITDRRRAPSREILLSEDDGSGEDLLRRALEPVSPGLDPEELLRRKQLRRELLRALDALPPPDRAIWIETEIEGRSFREIASDSGEPVGTLLSRKSRAGKLLRAHLRRNGHA